MTIQFKRQCFLSLLLLINMIYNVKGFTTNLCRSVKTPQAARAVKPSTVLFAWSLPMPPSKLTTFKSTWYNEVHNPTATYPIYDDSYNASEEPVYFVMPGEDWATNNNDQTSRDLLKKPRFRLNPVRRAVKWIRESARP